MSKNCVLFLSLELLVSFICASENVSARKKLGQNILSYELVQKVLYDNPIVLREVCQDAAKKLPQSGDSRQNIGVAVTHCYEALLAGLSQEGTRLQEEKSMLQQCWKPYQFYTLPGTFWPRKCPNNS
ncbi:hypothetical protein KAZ82_01755 [Candidatus Babeliales bacterium]|nr:hypothetical protein [Candidatus Babeliales bacterium]